MVTVLRHPQADRRGAAGRGVPLHGRWSDARAVALPCLTAAALTVALGALGWRGADYPAHLFRAVLWERSGISTWNTYWYGGHPTPTYSILAPPMTALFGAFGVAAISSVGATYCFARLTTAELATRTTALANHAFAVVVVVNVAVGRSAFSLGLFLALAALCLWHRGWFVAAVACAFLTPIASPVAAVFLAIGATAVALCRGWSWRAMAIASAATAPIALTTLLFHEPGRFPFRAAPFVASLAVLAAVGLVIRQPVARIGVALAIAASIAVFLIPNPLGGNYLRLAQIIAVPLAIAGLGTVRRAALTPLTVMLAVAMVWAVEPGIAAAAQGSGDVSSRVEYHRPLIDEVRTRNGDGSPAGRLEIPFTDNHWESLFVAPEVPYARGWERQLDLVRNPELYDESLTIEQYHDWLLDSAVRWIAIPDVTLDEGGRIEAGLITEAGTGDDNQWLEQVWSNEHWRLYEVLDYRPLVDPPARLVEQGPDYLVIHADRPATVTVRYEHTPHLTITGAACVREDDDGWVAAEFHTAGEFVLQFAMQPLGGARSPDCGDA